MHEPSSMSRAQLALRAARKACEKADRSRTEVDPRAELAERFLWHLIQQPAITFVAQLEVRNGLHSDVGPLLPAAFDLAYRLWRGLSVDDGRLPLSTEPSSMESTAVSDVVETTKKRIAELHEASIDFAVAWHVVGDKEVRFDHNAESDRGGREILRDALLAELEEELI